MKCLQILSDVKVVCIVFIICGLSPVVYAQESRLQLINSYTNIVITDVLFKYNKHIGYSDEHGIIRVDFKQGERLFLSHLQYGEVNVDAEELEMLLAEGQLKLTPLNNVLLPVTFVKFRSGGGEQKRMEITVKDKLDHDAGNLLEDVPAISSIRKSGAYGFDPVLRGFKYEQVNLVLDGSQTASAACPNRMDPAVSQIPINMITQAEVLKGPHNLRYGNAFGGTINFKSSLPEFKEKIKALGRMGTSYESNGNIYRTEGVAGVSGPKADFRLFGAYSTGNDYTDGDGMNISADFNRLNWGGKLGVKLNQHHLLGFLVSNNFAKDVDFPALPMDLQEDDTWLMNASHSARFYGKKLSSWNTSVYGTMVDHQMDNFDKVLEPRKADAETEAETNNYGGRTELRFDFNKIYLYAGFDYRFESANGYRTRTMLMGPSAGTVFTDNVWQNAEVHRTGLFAEFHMNKQDWLLVASGRLNFNSAGANNPDQHFDALYPDVESSHIHSSFSVGGTKIFRKNMSMGLWLGRATRSPGIAERYINQFPIGLDPYEMLGNPQLKPEVNNQADLIFRYQSEKTKFSVNVFAALLRDYISSEIVPGLQPSMASSPGVRQFVNVDKAFLTGFEFFWKQRLARVLSHDLSIVYTYGKNHELDEPLPEIPPLEIRYHVAGKFIKEKVRPELVIRRSCKQNRVANSYGETETPRFMVVDARVSWLINHVLTATGGVQNLFDKAYYEHLSRSVRNAEARPIYSPGRSCYLTLTLSFL